MAFFSLSVPSPSAQSILGQASVDEALNSSDLTSDPHRAGLTERPSSNVLQLDGDEHRLLRQTLSPLFTLSRSAAVEDAAKQALESHSAALDSSDMQLEAAAHAVAMAGLITLFEIESPQVRRLAELLADLVGVLEPDLSTSQRNKTARAAMRLALLLRSGGAANTSLALTTFLHSAAATGTITEAAAEASPLVVLHGGYENPLNFLSCLIGDAIEAPERFLDPSADAEQLCHEVLRRHTPAQRVLRYALRPTSVGRVRLKVGEPVWIDLSSANLENSGPPRGAFGGYAFGRGAHRCPGVAATRSMGAALIEHLRTLGVDHLQGYDVTWQRGHVASSAQLRCRRTDGSVK